MYSLAFIVISMILTPLKAEIFYNGAKILYSASVPVKSGYNEVILTGLLPGSHVLGVNVSRPCKIIGFDVMDSVDINDVHVNKLRVLYDSLKMKHDVLSWNYRIIENEKNFLLSLLSIQTPDSLKFNANELSLFLDTVKEKSNVLAKEEYIVNRNLKNIEKSMKRLSDSLRILCGYGIKVALLSKEVKKANIYIETFSPKIVYHPEYLLNAVPEKDMVLLLASANVKNNTLMTLNNVSISLVMQSFSYSGITNIVPEKYYYDVYYTEKVRGKVVAAPRFDAFKNSEQEALYSSPVVEEYATGERIVLKGKYTLIKGTSFNISMFEDTLTASFVRRAYPRKYNGVWLYGKVKVNRYPVELKNVRMLIDGVYQGRWSHPQRSIAFLGDTFYASFGRDEKIEVKRETVKSEVSENWQGKTIRSFHYRITLKNHWSKDVEVILYDNIPLFRSDRYKIKNVRIEPEGYDLNKESGIIKWDAVVPRKGKMIFNVSYEIVSNE